MDFRQDLQSRLQWGIKHLKSPFSFEEREAEWLAFASRSTHVTPGLFWPLACLVRYSDRQEWVAMIIRNRIQPDPKKKVPAEGIVPGLSEWEYQFHGIGCRLTHRFDGTVIDRDNYETRDGAEYVNTGFLTRFVESLKKPDLPEAQLLQSLESLGFLPDVFRHLDEMGVLVTLPYRNAFRLAPDREGSEQGHASGDVFQGLIEEFCLLCLEAFRRDRLAVIAMVSGDWNRVAELLSDELQRAPVWAEVLSQRQKEGAGIWRELCEDCWQKTSSETPLLELFPVNPARVRELAIEALQSPTIQKVSAVARLAEKKDLAELCPALLELLTRFEAGWCPPDESEQQAGVHKASHDTLVHSQPMPKEMAIANATAPIGKLLLRHGYTSDSVTQVILSDRHAVSGEVAISLLEHAPRHAPDYFRRVLREGTPNDRAQVAAALAILDETWGQDALVEVLQESTDREDTAEIRAALSHSKSPKASFMLDAWEREHPKANSAGPQSIGSLRDCDSPTMQRMRMLHARVLPLRGRVS